MKKNSNNSVFKSEFDKTSTKVEEPEEPLPPMTLFGFDYYKVIQVTVGFLIAMIAIVYFAIEEDRMYVCNVKF